MQSQSSCDEGLAGTVDERSRLSIHSESANKIETFRRRLGKAAGEEDRLL